jgi:hypothetical protein
LRYPTCPPSTTGFVPHTDSNFLTPQSVVIRLDRHWILLWLTSCCSRPMKRDLKSKSSPESGSPLHPSQGHLSSLSEEVREDLRICTRFNTLSRAVLERRTPGPFSSLIGSCICAGQVGIIIKERKQRKPTHNSLVRPRGDTLKQESLSPDSSLHCKRNMHGERLRPEYVEADGKTTSYRPC